MLKKIRLLIVFIILIRGIYLVYDWYTNQELYELYEADTLEEIAQEDLEVGDYVSFYIDDYVKKEISFQVDNVQIYVENNIEYERYKILIASKTSPHYDDLYICLMVKDQETKQKLKELEQGKVHFQGRVDISSCEIEKGIDSDCEKLIRYLYIYEQTELPDKRYDLFAGIALVILGLVGYRMLGGIKGCLPDVEIKPNRFCDYNLEYGTHTYNIRNDWMCEKDNLKNLQAEQIENKRVCNILIVVFIVGLILFSMAPMYLGKPIYFILMYIGIGGVWSRFINSSNELAVYIAKSRGKRSIYVEIEECKKNIAELERIMDEKNIHE